MMAVETADMESFSDYLEDVGMWKHQCYVFCDFNWRQANDMFENASMAELVNMIRGKYHYYNSGEKG